MAQTNPPPRRSGHLERPGCTIYYEVTGTGPAIVFAHGLGGNHMSWWQQVGHFAPNYTCVTFAHRGFAPSSAVPGGPDPADYADDLAALVAHLELADVRVVAQSMGGWSAVEYALRRPPGLKAVVLGATTGSIDTRRIREPERSQLAGWGETSGRVSAELFARGIHPAAGARMAEEQPALHLLYRHIDDMNAGLDKEALRRRLMEARVRAPEALSDIACPILMIANAEDPLIPPLAADAIAATVPGVRVAHIPQAGHSAYFERAAIYNRIVEEFLAGID
jgi:pimeloyl-ACP methyl ester carboxylesterase